MRAKKLIATAVAAAALGAGGLTVAAVNPLAGVGAQEEPAPEAGPDATADAGTKAEASSRRGHVVDGVLEDLVAEGTITQAQADAVKAAVKEKIEDRGPRRGHRRGYRRAVANAAEAIGIAPKDLVAGLKEGKSIAEIAQANDVEPQAVIDDLVAAGTARIDKAVAAGNLDADRAAKLKDRLPEAMEKLVNHKRTPR